MATNSYKVGPGSLILGAPGSEQEFSFQITSALVDPSVDAEDDINVLSGGTVAGDETETFVLSGNFLQDITAEGVTTWCWENSGTTQPFVYIPNSALARQVTGEVKVRKTAVGGESKTRAASDFEFPGVGEPVLGDVPVGP